MSIRSVEGIGADFGDIGAELDSEPRQFLVGQILDERCQVLSPSGE